MKNLDDSGDPRVGKARPVWFRGSATRQARKRVVHDGLVDDWITVIPKV
ncbi:MAG: hypothetical protein ACTSUE_09270 [Promethearchaeota archaeon]